MPLSPEAQRKARDKADTDLLIKGILCVLIGAAVLLVPHFSNSGMAGTLAQAQAVGWFATVLGCAFVGLYLRRRVAAKRP